MLAKVLRRELDQHRMGAVGNPPGGIRESLVVRDAAVGTFAVEILVVQSGKEQLQIGFGLVARMIFSACVQTILRAFRNVERSAAANLPSDRRDHFRDLPLHDGLSRRRRLRRNGVGFRQSGDLETPPRRHRKARRTASRAGRRPPSSRRCKRCARASPRTRTTTSRSRSSATCIWRPIRLTERFRSTGERCAPTRRTSPPRRGSRKRRPR